MSKKLLLAMLLLLTACSNGEQATTSEIQENTASSQIEKSIESEQDSEAKQDSEETASNSKFYGDLAVDGTNIIGEDGNPVQLKGISNHGINWFPDYVNLDLMTEINQQTEINTFRIAMYTEDYNGYLNTDADSQQQLLQIIDDAVSYATKLDMYVIIDWHILNDNNPITHQQEAIEFFTLMSEKYGDLDNVIFEICNEPNGDTSWADIESYANEVIPAIRANSDNIIIVGTPTWSQDVDQVQKLDYDNIVYTLHFYAATHQDDLRTKAQAAIDNDIPLFVSEFGITEASGNGAVDTEQADEWIDFLDENMISYVMWNLSNKDESSALIKSDVTKTSGFSKDDLTESGQWYLSHIGLDTNTDNTETKEEAMQQPEDTKQLAITNTTETWDNGGKYTFEVSNQTSKDVSDYQVQVTFDRDVKVTDNWNGTAKADGPVVTFTPSDYYNQITSKTKVDDLGIIIECEGIATIEKMEIV